MKNIDNYFEYLESLMIEYKEDIADIIESESHYNKVKIILDGIEDRILGLPSLEHQSQYAAFIVSRIEYDLSMLCNKYSIQPPYIKRDHEDDLYYWYVIDIGKFIDKIVYIFEIIDLDLVPPLETTIGYLPDLNYYDEDINEVKHEDAIFKKQFMSIMTQAQLVTMFRLFRDKGIVDKQMDNTKLARVIQSVAGGGLKRTKDYLGGGHSEHINTTLTKIEQADQIQNTLRELIQQIESEKQDIIK